MSGAVFRALADDNGLNSLGITEDSIFPDYSAEEVPRDGNFLVLRWGNEDFRAPVGKGPELLTVWAHSPQEWGSDYDPLRKILDRVKVVLTEMVQTMGEDGLVVTAVDYFGSSGNLVDPGFRTITRNLSFWVLLCTAV